MKARILLASLAIVASLSSLHATPPPGPTDALLADAWKAWEQGDQGKVERTFRDVLAQDPTSSRAHLGLSLLYSLQRRNEDALRSLESAIANDRQSQPYIYANWYSPMLSQGDQALAIKRRLTEQGDSLGILTAMAHEVLGSYYERQNDVSAFAEQVAAINAIVDWKVIGPFDNTSASGHVNVYPPEGAFDAAASYKGKGGVPTSWFRPAATRPDGWVDFMRFFANSDAIYYANTFVYAPAPTRVHLRVGTSGSFRAFVNDEMIIEESEELNNDLDTYIAETDLQQGWNRVLVKCGLSDIDRCNFLLRITDAHGAPLPGLKVTSETQAYKAKPGASHRTIENFAESFFREKIKENPSHLENYLLLAACYLRNDKATEAELTLRDALRLAPKSVVLLDRQLEAFVRGRKYDEVQKTLERIYAVDPRVPSAIEYKFNQHLETEEYDEAAKDLAAMESVLGDGETTLEMKIRLYSGKKQSEQVIETITEAYKRYPSNLEFVKMQSFVDAQTTNSADGSIRLLEKYLADDYDQETARGLANVYLSAKSDVGKWRAIYDDLLALDPAATGYLYAMSTTYFSAQQYDEAFDLMKRIVAICPGSSLYWARIGEIERIRGNNGAAIAAYRTALSYWPTDYDTRAKLRELEGKRSVFEQIPSPNIDSLIASAPTAEDYPNDKGVILVDDAQRVVYEGGASESSQEYVVKLFNNLAIDDWKEYSIPYNSYSEALIIEKAVAIKPDGTEIKADIDDNDLVFKSLEPGDLIRMKWRIKNHYAGRLAGHFWDTYHFNGFYPARQVRYAVLMPKDFDFRFTTQNMEVEPTKTTVEDGLLYQWQQHDLPAISYEYGMPAYSDVSKALHISSIKDWAYLVDWYRDLTRSKTKASFEVKEAVEQLIAGREHATTTEKIHAVYDYITENIRYSSVPFRQGSHVPQKARDVLVNRIGDCKDVATLCVAMLGELGITAHHVLLNTRDEGLNSVVLPSIPFNHCIVGVEIDGGVRYLDLTANNYPYGSLPDGDRGAFMLLVRPGVTAPEHLPAQGILPRNLTVAAQFDLDENNSLAGERHLEGTGGIAASIRGAFRDESKRDQEKSMVASLGEEFPNAKLVSLETDGIDAPVPSAGYSYRFEAPEYLNDVGSFKMLKLPWQTSASADQALSYEKREHAYDYWPSADTISEKITIALPTGIVPVELPAKQELSSPIADYSISYVVTGRTLTATRRYIYKKGIVAPEEYDKYKSFYNSVVKEDNRQILLKSGGAAPDRPDPKPARRR
jgi:tetratricopeptide (TPR) repeat protein